MYTLTNVGLTIYFALVSLIGTLGNGIILLAYGNRWNSSKSTSVIFILILACVDLWTCVIVVPSIAIMEYRDFEVPTLLCRFYSFSKILIIISSLIMSFVALDRFLNIAVPHHRLLNPRRVKCLLTLFISTGIVLGILTALAFSSAPYRDVYLANYTLIQSNDSRMLKLDSHEISLTYGQKNVSSDELVPIIHDQVSIPSGANLTNINLFYLSTHERCFADTSIISETIREILRHTSNKFFFISIGIVTILYTITFILALHRQNPRIRALKRSLNVLNKFNAYSVDYQQKQRNDSIASSSYSSMKTKSLINPSKCLSTNDTQQYEMASVFSNDELDEQIMINKPKDTSHDGTSEELNTSTEKDTNAKQVSFQIENNDDILTTPDNQQLPFLLNSSEKNKETYYKLPCPCSTTRQLLIKFHFAQPTFDINQWLCYCCIKKPSSNRTSLEDESTTLPINQTRSRSTSDTLRKQLHRHRIKQIRMASTFLLITVSFVLFYLPSILNAERYIKSPIMIYYLYLCTHALNPIIYCFMNMSLRAYVFSMLKCRTKQRKRSLTSGASTIIS